LIANLHHGSSLLLQLSQIFLKTCFKVSAFQLLSQILTHQNFGFHEVIFQSLIYKFIQILFAMSRLSIKSITKSVNNMAIRSIVFIDKLGFFFLNMYNKVTKYEKKIWDKRSKLSCIALSLKRDFRKILTYPTFRVNRV
jgi:hypothetical protein